MAERVGARSDVDGEGVVGEEGLLATQANVEPALALQLDGQVAAENLEVGWYSLQRVGAEEEATAHEQGAAAVRCVADFEGEAGGLGRAHEVGAFVGN